MKMLESQVIQGYNPPGLAKKIPEVEWVKNTLDGSILHDHKGYPVSVNRLLATKPLRAELSTRPGPGGKKLTYMSGEGVTRTLNGKLSQFFWHGYQHSFTEKFFAMQKFSASMGGIFPLSKLNAKSV